MQSAFRSLAFATAGVIALAAGGAASAANLVQNGGFETNGGNGQVGNDTTITNWSVPSGSGNSYVFVFNTHSGTSGTSADHTGVSIMGQYGQLNLWGPSDGGTWNSSMLSPNGGAFIGADPAFQDGAITQTLTGLTAGAQYTVSFDYAGAEQYGHTGSTSEGWLVGFGTGPTQETTLLGNNSKGFTGWQTETFTFTASGATDVLSFLAEGTGTSAEPPFALLDGVDVERVTGGVPEPATWAMMLIGLGGLGGALRMRRQQLFATA